MAVKHAALQRSLGALSFGIVREMESRKEGLGKTALRERDMHYQLPITGEAGPEAVWAAIDVKFRVDFVDATGQRDSPYVNPQVAFGATIESGGPARVAAYVQKWEVDDAGAVIGATLMVAVDNGTGAAALPFTGTLHATFSGYGAPNDAEQEET